jgi:mannose-6-phosphate isomerase-like protein (cupin superfamily)
MKPMLCALAVMLTAPVHAQAPASRSMVIVDEAATKREEAPPHGGIGMSTAYRISDVVPGRTMEFRKRVLHPRAAIGAHVIAHDEVYYVLSGRGEVFSGEDKRVIGPGSAAYLFSGETVGIRQLGTEPLTLIVAYPIPAK